MGHRQGGAAGRVSGSYGDTYTELPGMGIHALGPNAVLVLHGDEWTPEAAAALKEALRPDVLLISGGETGRGAIEVLDEDMMREHGWVRAPK